MNKQERIQAALEFIFDNEGPLVVSVAARKFNLKYADLEREYKRIVDSKYMALRKRMMAN